MYDLGDMPPKQAEVIRRSQPITPGSKPDLYLRSRGIELSPRITDLRMDKNQNMLALIRDKDGAIVSYQRTFLTQREDDGWDKLRMQAKGIKIPHGSAIRLYAQAREMGIAESTEDAISGAKALQVPVWSAMSAAQMARWEPPKGVEKLHIFAQIDRNFVGERAAEWLRDETVPRDIETVIHYPQLKQDKEFSLSTRCGDWNDYLREYVRDRESGNGQERCR